MASLAAVMVGLGFFAWLEHQELAALRAQIAEYQQHPTTAKKMRHTADDTDKSPDFAMDESSDDPNSSKGLKKGHKGSERADGSIKPRAKDTIGWRAYANMAGNPEFEKLSAAQSRAQAVRTYAPLLKSLNLPPDTQTRLQDLLGARQQAVADAVIAARENGLKSKTAPAEFAQATAQATAPVDAQIQQLLGNTAFGQLQQFQAAIPEQNLVSQLQQRLASTSTPLPNDQATQLLQMLMQAKAVEPSLPGTNALLAGGGVAKVTDTTLAVAQQVLTAPQVQALVQIQQERQQQSELEKIMKGKSPTPVAKPPGKN